jgi:hypothetical protein
VFLPLIGLFGANQLSLSWRARLGCCHARCGTQVMWSLHTLNGWMLRAEVTPDSLPTAPTPSEGAGEETLGGGTGGGGGGARREAKVWAEVILQRHPFQHVLASIGIPAALLGCEPVGEEDGDREGEGESDDGLGDKDDNAWIAFSLSMSSHADEPILFSASVGAKGRLFSPATGMRGDANSTRMGPVSAWRSWEVDDGGVGVGQSSDGGGARRQGQDAAAEERQGTWDIRPPDRLGQHQCGFSAVLDKTFIHGCAAPIAEDHPSPTQPGECPLSFTTLARAVASCSQREACGGVTFAPRRGVYELRAGPNARTGSSAVDGEVSWVRSSHACSGHLAVVPPQRCMTYSAPPKEHRRCGSVCVLGVCALGVCV